MGYINEQYYILSLAKAIVLQDEIPIDKSVNWKVIYNLCKYHKIEFNDAMEQMTMSEASRWIDKTILQYGRIKRFNRSDRNE